MPQELSEMRRSIYMLRGRLKDILKLDKKYAEIYVKLANDLQGMSEITEKYYTPDENGQYLPVSEQDLEDIKQQYNQLLDTCLETSAIAKNSKGEDSKPIAELVDEVSYLAIRDLSALQVVIADGVMGLPEIISKARTYTVELSEGELPQVDYEINPNVPMVLKNDRVYTNGHFVSSDTFDFGNKNIVAVANKLSKKYPEFNDVLEKLKTLDVNLLNADNANKIKFYTVVTAVSNVDENGKPLSVIEEFTQDVIAGIQNVPMNEEQRKNHIKHKVSEQVARYHFKDELVKLNFPENQIGELFKRKNVYKFLDELGTEMEQFGVVRDKYTNSKQWLGLQPGAVVYMRDVAMYSVAKLLGKGDLLAETRPVIITKEGKTIAGNFVENPSGINPYDISEDNVKIKGYTIENYDNANVFGDIAALQAIDYICGNVDRHAGSMLMNFDTDSNKLVSIKGVDNGFSFGVKVPAAEEAGLGSKWVAPAQMGAIGTDVAEKIMGLTEVGLSFALKGYGLSEQEIKAAWQRTVIMQNEIKKGIEHYKDSEIGTLDKGFLRVVPQENWKHYKLSQFAEIGDNQFKVFANMGQIIKEHDTSLQNEENVLKENYALMSTNRNYKEKVDTLSVEPIVNGLLKLEDVGVKLSEPFKIAAIDDESLPQVSGTKTVRYCIEFEVDGHIQQGFFTPLTEINERRETNRIMDDIVTEYPGYEQELEIIRHYLIAQPDLILELKRVDFTTNVVPYEDMGFSVEKSIELRKDENFSDVIREINKRFVMSQQNMKSYRDFGVENNSSIDQRNVAMTNVATLCGAPDLLAKSYNVQYQVGNRIVDGVFMETVKGVDIFRLNKNDPVYTSDPYVFDSGTGLKSMAELQVLDYLCMNMDRHEGNMIYQFSEGPDPKFIRVVGIDNDYAFGTKDPQKDTAYMVTSIDDIKVISERMAENIAKITPEELAQTLRDQKIGHNEIIAAQERLGRLQSRLKQKEIKIVKDDRWAQKTIKELAQESKSNIFSRIIEHTEKLRKDRAGFKLFRGSSYGDVAPIKYKKVEKVEEFSQQIVKKHTEKKANIDKSVIDLQEKLRAKEIAMKKASEDSAKEMKDFVDSRGDVPYQTEEELFKEASAVIKTINELLEDADPFYIRSSKQYSQLKLKAAQMNEYIKEIENREENRGVPKKTEINDITNGLIDLNKKVSEYVTYKVNTVKGNESKFNSLEEKRVLVVRTAGSLVKSVQATYEYNGIIKNYRENSGDVINSRLKDISKRIENAEEAKLQDLLATKLYYVVLRKASDGLNGKMQNALTEDAVNQGVEQIKNSNAFKNLMKNDSIMLVRMSRDDYKESLYTNYIKEMAALQNKKDVPGHNNSIINAAPPQNQI